MDQIKSFPVRGVSIAYRLDNQYINNNNSTHVKKQLIYPPSKDTKLNPGQVILGRVSPNYPIPGFWPSPHGLPAALLGSTETLSRHSFRVLGVASTEITDVDKGRLFSVVAHSPQTKFINTGSELIRSGQDVLVRLPTARECKQHMDKYKSYKFATYGRFPVNTTEKLRDCRDYFRHMKSTPADAHVLHFEMEGARKSFVSVFGHVAGFLRRNIVPGTDNLGTLEKWKEGTITREDFTQLFTDEREQFALTELMYQFVKFSHCISGENDTLVLGTATEDVDAYSEGRIALRTG